jgi:hypothetical protein
MMRIRYSIVAQSSPISQLFMIEVMPARFQHTHDVDFSVNFFFCNDLAASIWHFYLDIENI